MVASYVRERERIFLRWLENVERLLNQQVNRDAAYKAWRDGYSVRESAGEANAPQSAGREARGGGGLGRARLWRSRFQKQGPIAARRGRRLSSAKKDHLGATSEGVQPDLD